MKVSMKCGQCQRQDGKPSPYNFAVDIPERGWVEFTCDKGHRAAVIIQISKFEILSKMGVDAIAKGSYLEAVLSLAASLERLHEFFIEATFRKQGASRELFAEAWALMAKQSERQLGAFVAAFLLANGKKPKLLPRKAVELRNSIAHKGFFPTREESIEFGESVFECAHSVLDVLHTAPYAEITNTLVSEHVVARANQAVEAGVPLPSTLWMATPLSLGAVEQSKDFRAYVSSQTDEIIRSEDYLF